MILAIDTATRYIGLALHDRQHLLAEMMWLSNNNHTVELAPNVEKLLHKHQVSVSDLKVIGVTRGPGSFNGVRIGLAFAKGLAFAQHIPLIGVRTLDILARGITVSEGGFIAVIQAGRGRVIWARYKAGSTGWEAASAGEVSEWAALRARAAATEQIIGEIEPALIDSNQLISYQRQPRHLAELVNERWRRNDFDEALTLTPLYAHAPTSGGT